MRLFPDPEVFVPMLAAPLRFVPHPLQRGGLEFALEQLFRASVAEGDLDFLEGRCLAVEIEDAGWRWPIMLEEGRLLVLPRDRAADVTIRGLSLGFVAMAAGFEDPDTLFFQRRIVIEGDTELGLGVKNFLDGLDEERLPLAARAGLRLARHMRQKLRFSS